MGILNGTSCYLVGPIEYAMDDTWRFRTQKFLNSLGIKVYNPLQKPFLKDHNDEGKPEVVALMKERENGNFDLVTEKMKEVRNYDLNLVDRCDFIIANIIPGVASWGSAEELVLASKIKRPIFLSSEGGIKKLPFWLFAVIPHKYVYSSVDDIMDTLGKIDRGEKELDNERWRLLKPEYR